jgi:hypothetical protein
MLTAREAYELTCQHNSRIKQVEETIIHHCKNGDSEARIVLPDDADLITIGKTLTNKGYGISYNGNTIIASWKPTQY